MNLLDSNIIVIGLSVILGAALLVLRIKNSTKRHSQWLNKSIAVGLLIGPVLIGLTNNFEWLDKITLMPSSLKIIELALFSGLMWSLAATWLISVGQLKAVYEVSLKWQRLFLFYALLIALTLASLTFHIGINLLIVSGAGIFGVILSAKNPNAIVRSLISAIAFTILGLVAAYLATFFTPAISQYSLPFSKIPLVFPASSIIAVGSLAFLAPIISSWIYSQPFNRN